MSVVYESQCHVTYDNCGKVVKLEGKSGSYAVDGLDIISE